MCGNLDAVEFGVVGQLGLLTVEPKGEKEKEACDN